MCCGPKVHHDAMAMLKEQIAKSMVQRPGIIRIQPEILKPLVQTIRNENHNTNAIKHNKIRN